MALVGNLRDFGLSDFLYLVDRGYKTGGLHLAYQHEMALLFFEQGKLLLAVRRPEDVQAALLVRLGVLTAEELNRARSGLAMSADGTTLTQVIVEEQFVPRERLQRALQGFTEEAVYGLFAWPEGEFRFEQNQRPAHDTPVIPMPISVDHLIMEGVRRIDEWGRIKDRIPSTDMVARFLEQPREHLKSVQLSTTEWRLFARINGRDTLAELAQKTGMSDFEVCRMVYGFLTTGLVEVQRKPRPTSRGLQPAELPKVKKSLVNRIIHRIKDM